MLTVHRSAAFDKAFVCKFPATNGICLGKTGRPAIFKRLPDLQRHYEAVHMRSEDRTQCVCDYPDCDRSQGGVYISRKDHLREHYREHHLEDLLPARLSADNENSWWSSRFISPRKWRCSKCLSMNKDAIGWDCERCGKPCERERIEYRLKLQNSQNSHRHPNTHRLSTGEQGTELYERFEDGAIINVGYVGPEEYICAHFSNCQESCPTIEHLEVHFELRHFAYTHISPSIRHVCQSCYYENDEPYIRCVHCDALNLVKSLVQGHFIRSESPENENDLDSPASRFKGRTRSASNYQGYSSSRDDFDNPTPHEKHKSVEVPPRRIE